MALNRVVAIGFAHGPQVGLDALNERAVRKFATL
jgi:hypothetical protein